MTNLLGPVFTLVLLSMANDIASAFEYKNWKTFKSDFGYEVKYPDCWKIDGNNPDSGPIMERNFEISATEDEDSKSCKTPRIDSQKPNSIGVFAERATIAKADAKREIESETKASAFRLQRKDYLIFKKLFLKDGSEVLAHVETGSVAEPYARWHYDIYCPNRKMKIGGPTIRNPNKELLEKFEKGDLAIPEPYKTIYESFKCTEPKIK